MTPVQTVALPAIASITARKIEETVNLMDTEDAVKYLPSVYLRKRNNGEHAGDDGHARLGRELEVAHPSIGSGDA